MSMLPGFSYVNRLGVSRVQRLRACGYSPLHRDSRSM